MRRILILATNPKNTDKLRLDEEVREIQTGLERARRRDEFEIVTRSAVRVDDLRRSLLDYNPEILHFSGHGSGEQGLVLENHAGQAQVVSTGALASLFRLFQDRLECVVLNACYSQVQAEAIHQYIDCVIGMEREIGDRAAIQFAIGFYDGLGAGKSYQAAYELGCSAIALENIPEYRTPVLQVRPRPIPMPSTVSLGRPEVATPLEKPSQVLTIQGGILSGQVVQASGNVTQSQYSQLNGKQEIMASEVLELINQIQLLLETSTLPDKQKQKAIIHLQVARESVDEQNPDKNYAAESLRKAIAILKSENQDLEVSQRLWSQVVPILQQLLPWLEVDSDVLGF